MWGYACCEESPGDGVEQVQNSSSKGSLADLPAAEKTVLRVAPRVRVSETHEYSALLLQPSDPLCCSLLICCLPQMFARGSESHVYSALLLQQAYTARIQELDAKVPGMARKTQAMQRRLTQQINQLLSGANLANVVYSEAVPCRYAQRAVQCAVQCVHLHADSSLMCLYSINCLQTHPVRSRGLCSLLLHQSAATTKVPLCKPVAAAWLGVACSVSQLTPVLFAMSPTMTYVLHVLCAGTA